MMGEVLSLFEAVSAILNAERYMQEWKTWMAVFGCVLYPELAERIWGILDDGSWRDPHISVDQKIHAINILITRYFLSSCPFRILHFRPTCIYGLATHFLPLPKVAFFALIHQRQKYTVVRSDKLISSCNLSSQARDHWQTHNRQTRHQLRNYSPQTYQRRTLGTSRFHSSCDLPPQDIPHMQIKRTPRYT